MSRSGSVSFDWVGEERIFRLAIGQLCELQERCDAGPDWVLNRLRDGTWRIDDIIETIRLGLIGGGVSRRDANDAVDRQVVPSFIENIVPAIKILAAAIDGVPDESPKKNTAVSEDGVVSLPNGKWRFVVFYGDGAAMGLGADTIDRMSLWQFLAAQGGFERAHGGGSVDTGLSDEEFLELSELVDQ